MNRPVLSHQHNDMQKNTARNVLSTYSQRLQWHHDNLDALIDVGTGTGSVLIELIKPIMPKTYGRLAGCDISNEVISFARQYYRSQKKCEFHTLDIGTLQQLPLELDGQFDHVTSFNCLHWVNNQEQAFKNIYSLIKPEGGDCLLSFPSYLPLFDIYEALKDSTKWSPYIGHTDYFAGPLQRIEEDRLHKLLEVAGFHGIEIEMSYDVQHYRSARIFKDHMAAASMFLKHIPISMHEDLMEDFLEVARRLGCRASSPCGTKCTYSVNFSHVVVYAKKLPAIR